MELKSFISKPVLSSVISIVIVFVGIISLLGLPIEQYPDIAPPMVSVSTTYYGASAKTIQNCVIAPLEESINGVEGMTYMVSTTTNSGTADIQVYFKQGVDPDMAAVNVQNRVSKVQSQLPAEVKQYGVAVEKQQNSILQLFSISSPTDEYDSEFLTNFLTINIKPKIMRITGVGKFQMFGAEYSMRVWLKPDVMASHNLSPDDITAALQEQNIEAATGTFGDNSDEATQYTMVYRGKLATPEEFKNIIIRTNEFGEILKLGDIADVELGGESYAFATNVNGHPGSLAMIYQTAGSNATVVNNEISKVLEDIQSQLPPGVQIDVINNSNDFLYASIGSVLQTLYEAILLVILIVLLFLHDWRSTIIPFIGIAVSLVGTFAFMQVAGFSINLISLFALVLVIGTVVDDAIVVVEAVHEKLDAGYKSPMKASIDAMGEITTAIITSSLVFMAVFIPVSFMGGTSGTFFRQFGLTMAVAVGISAINALTLSPALCALLIKPKDRTVKPGWRGWYQRFSNAFDTGFEKWSEKYKNGIVPLVEHKWIAPVIVIAACVLMGWTMATTPTGFVPEEDRGLIFCDVMMPASSTRAMTEQMMDQMAAEVREMEGVETVCSTAGYSFSAGQTSSGGFLSIKMKIWDDREDGSLDRVMQQIQLLNKKYTDATIVPFTLPMIPGYGTSSNAEINLQDKTGGDINEFMKYTEEYIVALNKRPEIGVAYTTFRLDNPQWLVDVNVAKCHNSGVTVNNVMNTLATYCGGTYVGDFNRFGKVYKVMVQGTPESHRNERSLETMFVKLPTGEMAALSNFVTLKKMYGAEQLSRFNMLNSIKLSAAPAPGASSGDVIKAAQEVAAEVLPSDYTFEFGGMSREESDNGGIGIMFLISALFIYLILSAMYESYIVPFSIILTVPIGIMGAFLFTKIFGLDNNIYLQTGVVMLIGLISKTGILIVEYALQKREQGMSILDSALEAAKVRLRPILMTAGTMIIGLLPLLTSTGCGAKGNMALGVGTIFGMTMGTVGLLFITPALFVVFQTIQEKVRRKE